MKNNSLIVKEDLTRKIYTFRNTNVMLDSDLAKLYDIPTGRLNEAVKRNINRFPKDFMFQLTKSEQDELIAICDNLQFIKYSPKTPFVFTEQGVAMLSGVLKSERAIQVNIYIMRAFVAMRRFMQKEAIIFAKLDSMDKRQVEYQLKTDNKFSKVFEIIEDRVIIKKRNIFYDGQIFDAYKFVNDLLKSANNSIILMDNYIDECVLVLFSELRNINITIYTENLTEKLKLDIEKYNQQYSKIEIKKFKKCHDRFLIIDNKEIYHFGASIKDLGKKWFSFSKMDSSLIPLILKKLE